jgi:hypothetical protein
MDYKVVRSSHVVTRGYLRGFAAGEIIAMYLVGESVVREIPVSKAGVLNDFYARHRPDGTRIDDIEWSLEHIDKVVPPLLREISQRWPLGVQEKAMLAEFLGIQMTRGPRWRQWHEAYTSKYFDNVRASGEFEGKQPEGMTVEELIAEVERVLISDTETLRKMLEMSRKATEIIGSMHWTLVEFAGPWLATSDHPVVVWPLGVPSRQPKKSGDFVAGGLVNTLEARFPLSRSHALLMTWLDLPDDQASIVKAAKDTAANFNAFTVAEAEHQWFHLRGVTPPRASGQLLPIAPRLLPGYSVDLALASRRRTEANRRVQQKVGDGKLVGFEFLRITPAGELEIVRALPPGQEDASSDDA